MPVSPCCEYYGCLPKLFRKSTTSTSASVAALPVVSTAAIPPCSAANDFGSSSTVRGNGNAPSTYTLSEPLTYAIAELPPKPASSLRLVVISDTHERHREMTVPNGDVLVHCGDIQEGFKFCRDADSMLVDFSTWINDSVLHPHPVKLIIAGNHDKAIAKMKADAVRKLFAPALYLCDESAVIEPAGVRVFGSPRSISNSCFSPNTAFQSSKWWMPFMFPFAAAEHTGAARVPLEKKEKDRLHARLEGETPRGPIDILLTHQSPDAPRDGHTIDEQPISTYVHQVAPRRAVFCGHLHGAHGMHRLSVPFVVKDSFALKREESGQQDEHQVFEEIPFTPCINAAMMMGLAGPVKLLPASVVDLQL